ncbi:uncharacterized protein LOC141725105 [Apium graveolens]|uniref:uncharacterized protein LOC141725105 n=1 Tax=Apium graveolens TaxID=4045 RepID=UPI003D7A8357
MRESAAIRYKGFGIPMDWMLDTGYVTQGRQLHICARKLNQLFVDEINSLASYQWWEGSTYSIISIFAYPLASSCLQWHRKNKIHALREYVRSEYDHSCLRSCRSRALYEWLKHLVEIVTVGDVIAFLASGVLIAANISFIDSISLFTLINIVFPISLSSDSY